MGSLPALYVQPPQDATQGLERAVSLRNLLQNAPIQHQILQQQAQAGALENQQRQMALKDQQAMTAAMQQWDGKNYDDLPGLVLKQGGSAQAVMGLKSNLLQYKTGLANLTKDQLAAEKTKNDYFAQAIDNVKSLPQEQQAAAFESAKQDAVQKGHLDPQQAQGLTYQGPQQLDLLEKSLKGHDSVIEQSLKEQQTKEAAAKTEEATSAAAKNTMEVASGGTGAMADSRYRNILMKPATQRTAEDTAFLKAYEKQKTLVPQATINLQGGLLNDQAQQMAAQYYAQTGQLPAGLRSPAMSAKILNKAAGAPGTETPNIAANKATYAADTASLTALQKNFDQVTAFENTAGKNLDLFLNTAKKAIDTGSPWINQPLRTVNAKGLGDADQAAFNVARQTAVTEIAKVLNSSNASGVLSDSARHEVEGLIGPGASLRQIYSAANILKQDMANRHQAYADQISAIKGRASGKPAQAAAETRTYQGHTYEKQPDGSWKLSQ